MYQIPINFFLFLFLFLVQTLGKDQVFEEKECELGNLNR